MLSALPITPPDSKSLTDACWIDLVDPTSTETAAVEKAFGLRVPTAEELSEIETTSRLQVDHDARYVTAPLIVATDGEPWIAAPTGFVLSKTILLTVRYVQSMIFDSVSKEFTETLIRSVPREHPWSYSPPLEDGQDA